MRKEVVSYELIESRGGRIIIHKSSTTFIAAALIRS